MKTTCPFCNPERIKDKAGENGSVFALEDGFHVTPGHMLIIPHRHTADYFTMTTQELHDAADLIRYLRDKITSEDPTVLGFNVGINCGETAGQSVMHAHIHLIPRRKGDSENPLGGVRGVIPCKRSYKHR
ncbi:MAG: HIT family protein [Desulfotomaculaceae bacterium]|nr:HIT family protein [Desulfotomaculaceae bacterium]